MQVLAHQGQCQGQAANGVDEVERLLFLVIHHAGCQHPEQCHALVLVEFADHGSSLASNLCGDAGKARGDEVSAVGATGCEGQRVFKMPGIVDHQQHGARTDGAAQGCGLGIVVTEA